MNGRRNIFTLITINCPYPSVIVQSCNFSQPVFFLFIFNDFSQTNYPNIYTGSRGRRANIIEQICGFQVDFAHKIGCHGNVP